jgi:hypothetical protein
MSTAAFVIGVLGFVAGYVTATIAIVVGLLVTTHELMRGEQQ